MRHILIILVTEPGCVSRDSYFRDFVVHLRYLPADSQRGKIENYTVMTWNSRIQGSI